MLAISILLLCAAFFPATGQAAINDVTLVSSGAADPTYANGDSGPALAISADGRYFAFESRATNLSDGAQPGVVNVYLRDRKTGTTTLVSRASGADGVGADGDSTSPSISPAGRFVAFESGADNLSADDDDAVRNVYVRDTVANTTTLVSRGLGAPANGDSSHPAVSVNGTSIAFASTATNLTADALNAASNIYVSNLETGETTLVSRIVLGSLSIAADGNSYAPTIDRDGRRVAYTSEADNLSSKDDNRYTNVFVTDLQTRFTSAVSLPTGGFLSQLPSDGDSFDASISADGRYVAFVSNANNFVDEAIRTPQIADVFRRDIQASDTVLVSRATGLDGAPAFASSAHPSISGDGRFVAFESAAGNLSTDDAADADIFIRNMDTGTTTLASRASGAAGAVADASSYAPVLARNGAFVAFSSDADNLLASPPGGPAAYDTSVRNVFARQVPVTPPRPETGPDLGSNDHSAHDGHAGHDPSSPGHTGHTAAEHAGHVTATGGPAMTLFGPPIQDVDKLYMLVQPHADANVVVSATVTVPGKARGAKVYSFRTFSRKLPAHKQLRVKLKLAKSQLKRVKRAMKRRKLKAKIVGKAQNATGGGWTTIRKTVRLTN